MQRPDFKSILQSAGFRSTRGRLALLNLLWKADKPMNIAELQNKIPADMVTLYRSLNALADRGLLLRGQGTGEAVQFLYPKNIHHHHLVCMDCGFIRSCSAC